MQCRSCTVCSKKLTSCHALYCVADKHALHVVVRLPINTALGFKPAFPCGPMRQTLSQAAAPDPEGSFSFQMYILQQLIFFLMCADCVFICSTLWSWQSCRRMWCSGCNLWKQPRCRWPSRSWLSRRGCRQIWTCACKLLAALLIARQVACCLEEHMFAAVGGQLWGARLCRWLSN